MFISKPPFTHPAVEMKKERKKKIVGWFAIRKEKKKTSWNMKRRWINHPALIFFMGGVGPRAMKIVVRSRGTPLKNPCGGGSNFRLTAGLFLGAGGHTNSGFSLCSSDLGVSHSSSTASGEAFTLVLIGVITGNSSTNSKPMVHLKTQLEFPDWMVPDVE